VPPPDPTPPTSSVVEEALRRLAGGNFTGYSGNVTLAIEDQTAWDDFWAEHASFEFPPADEPAVDFAHERVIVAAIGPQQGSCWSVEVTRAVTDTATSVTRVDVVTHGPRPGAACEDYETVPIDVVAVARVGTRFEFTSTTVYDAPPA
jgi:hypothetical protein